MTGRHTGGEEAGTMRDDPTAGRTGEPAADRTELATAQLRAHDDELWLGARDRLLAVALTAPRRSLPVRAQASSGPIHISEHVLVAHLRAGLDREIGRGALGGVTVQLTDADTFAGVTIELTAPYPEPIAPLVDQVRAAAAATLRELLGPVAPPVTVRTTRVDVTDVAVGRPGRIGSAAV